MLLLLLLLFIITIIILSIHRAPGVQRDYELKVPVNDVIIHPNQGELISCDQSGSIKVWDLSANENTYKLVKSFYIYNKY